MLRLILVILAFLASLLTVFPIPARQIWYTGVAVTEFSWVFAIAALLLLIWSAGKRKYRPVCVGLSVLSLACFLRPIISAAIIGRDLKKNIDAVFPAAADGEDSYLQQQPFSISRMFGGTGVAKRSYDSMVYVHYPDSAFSLNFYKANAAGLRPCVIVVHGGSWKKGSNAELPDVNSYLAQAGYHVASINYRLAPQFKSPAQVDDVAAALRFLCGHAQQLEIDTNDFVLTGRSAGGQIVLAAAYSLHHPGIRGVMSFYGPTDMKFGYADPHNILVMDHRKVMEDFLGGDPGQVPRQYDLASATYYVDERTVPTLLIHGKLDAHVHYEDATILDSVLRQHHVPHFLLGLPWATHGCEYSLKSPSGQLAMYAVERFLFAVTGK